MGQADRVRTARPEEAAQLTALARRSKGHWGYEPALLALFARDLEIRPADILAGDTWILENNGAVLGFCRVVAGDPAVLADLWLEPAAIGFGRGRRLWEVAVTRARADGAAALELDADPHAVGFYERMGARQVGETASVAVPGRSLPRMRIDLR